MQSIMIMASELKLGNLFWYEGHLWQHCGWYSAVCHICGFCPKTDEKRVISRHAYVGPFEETYFNGLGI